MIRVSAMYPYSEGKKFDIDYYCSRHMPMVRELLGSACKGMTIDSGLSGATPGSAPAFAAIGCILFDSVEAFQAAFTAHAGQILGDIPNYTDIELQIQLSEVRM